MTSPDDAALLARLRQKYGDDLESLLDEAPAQPREKVAAMSDKGTPRDDPRAAATRALTRALAQLWPTIRTRV